MAKRVYDKGSLYGISIGEDEIRDFRRRWPASGLDGLRNLYAAFEKDNGDLVELECNRREGCEEYDGPALAALTNDMQCVAERRLKLDTGRCPSKALRQAQKRAARIERAQAARRRRETAQKTLFGRARIFGRARK